MFKHNFLTYSGKIIVSLILEIVYFPIWWYSVGFFRTSKNVWNFLRGQEKSLGFSVWAKNIFVPMYGQSDWAGRLISFLVRLVQVIFRGFALLIWTIICIIVLLFWLALPLMLLFALFFQILK
ncbi:MAG: hypothetical protein WCN88_02175 [Candidatus Falkowbacteria bacterium]